MSVGPKQAAASLDVRFISNSVRISAAEGIDAKCHKRLNAPQRKTPLFDHLVGAREQRRQHREAERLRGSQVL
jgi:hypothetical protein